MTIIHNLPIDTLDNWLIVLKPFQREIINQILVSQNNDVENVAEKWLTTTGSPNIVTFGGIKDSKPFWENFKKEFSYFLCDDTKYIDIKKSLKEENPVVKTILVSSISSAIGATLGYSAALLSPVVVLMLYTTAKIGISAYCKTYMLQDDNIA